VQGGGIELDGFLDRDAGLLELLPIAVPAVEDGLGARGERRGVIASDVADVLLAASTAVDAAVRRLGA
jgi:hypothetical protein